MILGGLDVGTTGCKIVLYNEKAELLETYYREYNIARFGGQHEIEFSDIINGVINILKVAVKNYKIDALGVTSFGETFAMLDKDDNPLAPAMLYTDPRGAKECELLCEHFGKEKLTLLTGVEPNEMYSICKIMWLKENKADAFEKCKRILLGEDYIVYMLSGVAQIDYSLAARTGAFDIEKKCFSAEIFDFCGVDLSLMSKPVEAGTVAGNMKEALKQELGIDYDIKIVSGCHDQVAGMIGSGVFDSTKAMDGAGTVECIPVILDYKPENPEFYKGGYSLVPFINGKYALYAFSFTGGATIKWFRDNFAQLEFERCEKEGKNVYAFLDSQIKPEPTGILILPHFAGAATPYMDSDSKAAFVGITLETTKFDIYKALMEGVSYEMLLNFETVKRFIGEIKEIRATGGGATSDIWLQIKADILDTEITALSCKEVGAAGTTALVGVALGVYSDLEWAVSKMAPVRRVFKPNSENTKIYSELYKKYANLYNAVKGL